MLKLIINDPKCNLANSYRDADGFFSVPIPETVSASLNYDSASLSELGNIIAAFSNSFELVADQPTQDILSRLHFRKNRQGLSARIKGGLLIGGRYYPGLIVVERSVQNLNTRHLRYNIQFLGTHQTWKDAARNMSICQIDCGTFFNSAANLEASWDNDMYVPGGQPYYLPLVSKGPWLNPAYRVVEDFDFICVYLAHLLLQGFCQLGYTIQSEFVHTSEFRKKVAYLLSDAFFNREDILKFGAFRASWTQHLLPVLFPFVYGITSANVNFGQLVICDNDFTSPNFDANGLYHPNNPLVGIGQFTGYTGSCSFTGTIDFTISPTSIPGFQIPESAPTVAYALIMVSTSGGNNIIVATGQQINVIPNQVNTVSVITSELLLEAGDRVSLHLKIDNVYTTQTGWIIDLVGATFSNNPSNKVIQRDQTLRISDLLDCNISFYTVLEDLTKLYNLQFYTNEVQKTVHIEPEYRWRDWSGLYHNGIRREISQAYDISDVVNTEKDITKDFSAASDKRFVQFLFVDGGDYYCTRYKEENLRELHSSDKIDIGEAGNETEEIRLSIFRPTQTIYDGAGFQDPYAIQIPAYWNAGPALESGSAYPLERAYSIGGRILHIHGMTPEINKFGNLPVWYFEDLTPRNAYPKAYQLNQDNPASASSIVFGSAKTGKTQLSTFHRNLAPIKQQIEMQADLTLQPNNVACLDTRRPVLIDSGKFPPEIAGYYYIKRLSVGEITKPAFPSQVVLVPMSFVSECESLCNLSFTYSSANPSVSGGDDGSVTILSVTYYTGTVSIKLLNADDEVVFSQTGIDPLADLPLTIPDLVGGVYALSIIDEAGCTIQAQIVLTNPCETAITASGVNPSSQMAVDGSITLTALTGVVYPVAVIVKQGFVNVFTQSGVQLSDLPLTVPNLSAATYTIVIIDSAGCSTSSQLVLTYPGAGCFAPTDFAVVSATSTSITLHFTPTVGNTYNMRWRLVGDTVWQPGVNNTSENITVLFLEPCLQYEFQLETICNGDDSIGYGESIFGTTNCPCNITFTVTPNEAGGIDVTNIEGLSEGASPIIVVTDCDGNPVPNWWESIPECYKICVIDSCTCCRGCQTSCFITIDELHVTISECDDETGAVDVFIDILATNVPGNEGILYYSLNGITWVSGGISTMGVGWNITGVPGTGGQLYVRVENPDDSYCNDSITITLPNCCDNNLGLQIVTDACDNYQVWITSDSYELPYSTLLINVTVFGITYTPPAPLPFTDLQAVQDWLNGLGLPVYFTVVLPSVSSANVYIIGECCETYEAGDFKWTYQDGETTDEITLDFLANLNCVLITSASPDFECCTCIQAVATGTAANIDTDVIEYSLDGGDTWLPYAGECIETPPVLFRRTVTFTSACPTEEIIEEYPVGCDEGCAVAITGVEISGFEFCDSYRYYQTFDYIPQSAIIVSITINGVTYTPPAPIPYLNNTALQTWLNSLTNVAKFLVYAPIPGPGNVITIFVGCADALEGHITYTNGGGPITNNFFEGDDSLILTCEQIQTDFLPDFDCLVACNEAQTVDITVSFSASCGVSNGYVTITISDGADYNAASSPPFEAGFTVFPNVPANGATYTIRITDFLQEQPDCEDEVTIVVPDCTPPEPEYNLRIGGMAFGSAGALETYLQVLNPTATVTNYNDNGDGTEDFLVAGITGLAAHTFNANTYAAANSLTVFIDLTDFITDLGAYCFHQCSAAETYVLNGAINIGNHCFSFNGTPNAQTCSLNSAQSVGDYCFLNAGNLTSLSLPSVINLGTTVGDNGVFQNTAITALTVPIALATVNAGNPDGDITQLIIDNGATITYI